MSREKDVNNKERRFNNCRKSTSVTIMTKITNKTMNKMITNNKLTIKIILNNFNMESKMIFSHNSKINLKSMKNCIKKRSMLWIILELLKLIEKKSIMIRKKINLLTE